MKCALLTCKIRFSKLRNKKYCSRKHALSAHNTRRKKKKSKTDKKFKIRRSEIFAKSFRKRFNADPEKFRVYWRKYYKKNIKK